MPLLQRTRSSKQQAPQGKRERNYQSWIWQWNCQWNLFTKYYFSQHWY